MITGKLKQVRVGQQFKMGGDKYSRVRRNSLFKHLPHGRIPILKVQTSTLAVAEADSAVSIYK